MVVHVSCKPGHCYKFSPSPNTGDFCWSSNFVSALSSSQSNKKERIEAETEINTLCCCPPIFCVDFLICRNCRMYLFNLQSYLKNYTLCTPPPYPPMIVPCWCASYLSKLLNVFVSIEKMYFFNLQNYSNNQHTLLLLHPPIIVAPICSANILCWLKSFLLPKKIQILCQRSKFYALFWPAWTLEWVMMSRQTWWACFYNNSNIGKNKVTPW